MGDRVAIVSTPAGLRRDCLDAHGQKRSDEKYRKMLEEWQARQKCLLCSSKRPEPARILRRPRNDDGISIAMDRMKCLGNSVVPQQFYPIFKAIAEIEAERVSV